MVDRKTLSRFAAVVILSVVVMTAVCGALFFCSAAELVGKDPYPNGDVVSPGFGEYDKVSYKEGYKAKAVNDKMSPWEFYSTMVENFNNVDRMAQLSTTISDIQITMTTPAFLIIQKGTKLGVVQVSSLLTANDGYGNTYYQAISQMETLGDDLSYLNGLVPNFGLWEKRKYVADEKTTYVQKGRNGSRKYDENVLGGITCTWIEGTEEIKDDASDFDSSVFNLNERVLADTENEYYKVDVGPAPYDNDQNTDEEGNTVIKVNFKTNDGGWSYDFWYMWDDLDNTATGKYVYFVGDRNNKAWPARGDAVSSYIINEQTFDNENSKITESVVDGKKLYTLNVVLKESGPYTWDLITSGEKKYLQDGTKGFVDFPMSYASVRNDIILRYEVWENGSIRRIVRQYTMDLGSEGGSDKGPDKTSVLGGQGYGYGVVTNTQYQEFAYDGEAVDFMGYGIGDGVMPTWQIVLIAVGAAVVVAIAIAVTVIVLRKKGIIGKNKIKGEESQMQ